MKTAPPTKQELDHALNSKVGKQRADIETQLLRSVLDYLGIIGLLAFRRNVGALPWVDSHGKQRLVKFNEPGQADVWFIGPNGVHGEIELKKPNAGKDSEPRENQRVWLKDVQEAGGIGICVTSLKEVSAQLKAEFIARELIWLKSWDLT